MFGELLESRARPIPNRGGAVVSIVAHVAVIAVAVVATRTTLIAKASPERVIELPALRPDDAVQSAAPSVPRPVAPASLVPPAMPLVPIDPGPSLLLAPATQIDLSHLAGPPATDIDWAVEPSPVPGGIARDSTAPPTGGTFTAITVEKPAIALPGNPVPRYPELLRRANQRGEVVIEVVIDTNGTADIATARVIESGHPLFTDAVLAALPGARFRPAEWRGRKVRMWAVQRFVFEVR